MPKKGFMDVIEDGQDDEGMPVQDGEQMWDDNAGSLSPPFPDDMEAEGDVSEEEDAVVAEICADPEVCRQVHLYQC